MSRTTDRPIVCHGGEHANTTTPTTNGMVATIVEESKNRFTGQLKQCLSPPLLWWRCPHFSAFCVFLMSTNRLVFSHIVWQNMALYNTYSTTRNYSLREESAVTGMSMKCKGALLTNWQVAHISFRHIIFIIVGQFWWAFLLQSMVQFSKKVFFASSYWFPQSAEAVFLGADDQMTKYPGKYLEYY